MEINLLYEADQIVEISRKFTAMGFMVSTMGSISVCDSEGNLYISPQKFNAISPESKKIIVIDKYEKKYYDIKKASIELPIHQAIYDKRLDVNAICHIYSPAIAALTEISNQSVFNLFPRMSKKIGVTHFSDYPTNINTDQVNAFVSRFVNGASNVIVEDKGVFVTGRTIFEAYHKAEMLDHFAKIYLNAIKMGDLMYPAEDNIEKFSGIQFEMPQYLRGRKSNKDIDNLKTGLALLAQFAYRNRMATSVLGTMSVRVSKDSYLTVPGNTDKALLDTEKLVLMKHSKSEAWKTPNEDIELHEFIYNNNPSVSCVSLVFPTYCMGYSFTDESLKIDDVKLVELPFEANFDFKIIDKAIKEGNKVLAIDNDIFLVVANDLQEMNLIFDKMMLACQDKLI